MESIKTIEKDGFKAEIFTDDDPFNPREECDHLGKMVCFHKRYNLGDDTNIKSDDFNGWEELETYIRQELKAAVVLPIYMYDHSGITINTTGFSCPWDSGQVGFIYATRDIIKKEYELKRNINPKTIQKVKDVLEAEVREYDQYITGEVYRIEITGKDGEVIDSCSGFYGMKYAEEQANEMLDLNIFHEQHKPSQSVSV